MTAEQQVIKHSQLLNRLVMERRTAEEVGRVEQLWLDPQSHQIVGLTCKSGFLGQKKRSFTWAQIETIGADSILVNSIPEGADPEKPGQVVSLIGHEVWTDAGNKAGKVVDYLLDTKSGTVVNYLFSSSGWRGVLDGIYLLPSAAIANPGSKRVMVADAVVQAPVKYAEGLEQKVSQAAENLKEDYQKSLVNLEAVKRKAQNFAEQAKDKAQEVTEKAKEGAHNLAEQAKDKAQEVREKTKEGAHNLAEQAKDKAQEVREKAKEGAHNLAEQAKDKAQEVTEKAKEKLAEVKAKREEGNLPPNLPTTVDIDAEPLPLPPKEPGA